ncbi:hypothetical protein EU537_07460 [Candidatus Thorarchaeota archaeon]|nr:MAG: hypothetical protein EU537_07460 [Candidatus Thorarchaeota archaeon]
MPRIPPWASLVWGALSYLFFTFPGLGFMLSASVVHLVLYCKLKSNMRENGQNLEINYYSEKKKSYLEILDAP